MYQLVRIDSPSISAVAALDRHGGPRLLGSRPIHQVRERTARGALKTDLRPRLADAADEDQVLGIGDRPSQIRGQGLGFGLHRRVGGEICRNVSVMSERQDRQPGMNGEAQLGRSQPKSLDALTGS